MTTQPDRTDARDPRANDDTITVTSMDPDGQQSAQRDPVGSDGLPIFPPEPSNTPVATGATAADLRDTDPGERADRSYPDRPYQDTRTDDDFGGEPIGNAGRLLPDGTGSTAPDTRDAYDQPVEADTRDAYDQPAEAAVDYPPSAAPVADDGAEPVPVAAPEPAHPVDDDDEAWVLLQGKFVDDPAQAVREAGERVEGELRSFRDRLDSADTEALRTAFKQFRDLSAILR